MQADHGWPPMAGVRILNSAEYVWPSRRIIRSTRQAETVSVVSEEIGAFGVKRTFRGRCDDGVERFTVATIFQIKRGDQPRTLTLYTESKVLFNPIS